MLSQHDARGVLAVLGDVRDGRVRQVRPLLPVLLRRKHVLNLPVLRRIQGVGVHGRLAGKFTVQDPKLGCHILPLKVSQTDQMHKDWCI